LIAGRKEAPLRPSRRSRPSQTTIPDGAVTTYTYTYYNPTTNTGVNTQTATVDGRWQTTTLDGFGRTVQVQKGNGSTIVSTVQTQYAPCACSPLGKMSAVSQPYGPGTTVYWTTYTYDGSGRTLTVTAPDGASTTNYTYQGNSTTVTDPAGKWKTSTVDAYGNLALVTEPNPAGGTFTTTYTYTRANQLTGVSMTRGNVTQTRTFVYTGSDMTSATNPENGTVTYVYDSSHRVTSRTDALGSQTVYTYDSYGRLSEVQYYPGFGYYKGIEDPNQRVTYYYDGNFQHANPCLGLIAPSSQYSTGRLSAVIFAGGIADAYKDSYCYQYAYTKAGRVATQQMMVNGAGVNNVVNFTASYQWDAEGRMTSLQYPTVTAKGLAGIMPIAAMQYDVNGRLSGMTMDPQNGNGPQPFASASYYPSGQLNTLQVGGWTETRTYNSLMQLISQSVPYGPLNMTYNYSATQNNGRITSSVDGMTGENTTYTYDALNRLTNASNSLWSEAYGYDGFGNLTSKTGSGGSPNPAPTVSMTYNSKNQLTNIYYDANGNQNGAYSPYTGNTYSVENRLTMEVLGSNPYPANIYAYDPWGKRVMSGYSPNYLNPQPTYNYTFYGVTGQKLAMVTCNGSNYPAYPTCAIVGQNVYFGKKLVTAGGVNVLTDRLGSVRANGQGESFAYYPYGEERTNRVDGREKFGTYFRDAVGQDYADQRYYNAGLGRFWSPDPKGKGAADPSNPASWNLYSYVNGDPVNSSDPTGEDPQCGPTMVWDGEGCMSGGGSPVPDASTPSSSSYVNSPFSGGASLDIATGEISYVVGTVLPGYLNSATSGNPVLQQIVFPSGSTTATITYTPSQSTLSAIVSAVTSVATYLPQQFYSGFVNALLNDDTTTGALQVAGSLAAAVGPGAIAEAFTPATLYHFTSTEAASGIAASGTIYPGAGLFGWGVYGSAFNSATAANLMGAASTEAVVPFASGLGTVPSAWGPIVIPGAYRTITPISIFGGVPIP